MTIMNEDLFWYKNAVIYELHVRAFSDSNADGTGDFRGLIGKLDYLADLGVTAIWLLPFYPSPLKDDGYDIANYWEVHPDYGSLEDFKTFLDEAHKRGMRVITELVINHTSDQHEWFQKSRRAEPGSYWRDFYVWSETPEKYKEVRIIFKDFEPSNWSWDPVAKAYYWHRFFSHQPDLNFDNPEVEKAIFKVLDYWMDMGVDGLRLDAVPYLYEREGTSCENLPETHAFLRRLRKHVDTKYPGRMLLAEANQWPEDAVAYFGQGDECHMNFHFPLMPRLFMSIKMEDRYSIIDILKQTPEIHESCQWATFLRNHDELTLEMVTDEERDYMYKVYASDPRAAINLGIRRRLAPLVSNDRRQIELLNGLLFSMPGTPVLYYGDEIGMGDNIHLGDRNGVRTPFQWSPDRNAGFSKADPQSLYLPVISSPEYAFETLNVETAQRNEHSLLWWTKKLIAIRKAYPDLSSGKLRFVESANTKVLSFLREGESTILVVANLSRTVQCVELDLQEFAGQKLYELFGQVEFPEIADRPFFLTLGPYSFYWFEVKKAQAAEIEAEKLRHPIMLKSAGDAMTQLQQDAVWNRIETKLLSYLSKARWFLGKNRVLRGARLFDAVEVEDSGGFSCRIFAVKVSFRDEEPDYYILPIAACEGEEAEKIIKDHPASVISTFRRQPEGPLGIYYEATFLPQFGRALYSLMKSGKKVQGQKGTLSGRLEPETSLGDESEIPLPQVVGAEQSNSAYIFEKSSFLKLYRRLESGVNPEVTVGRHLAQEKFENTNRLEGVLTYTRDSKPATLGCLLAFIPNEGDGWSAFLNQLMALGDQAAATLKQEFRSSLPAGGLAEALRLPVPEDLRMHAGPTFTWARDLGQRTAEMHLALARADGKPDFQPETYTPFYQRSLYQSFRNMSVKAFEALRKSLPRLPEERKELARIVLEAEDEIYERFSGIKSGRFDSIRTRVHGDYHLGQVLFTGRDFFIIDFEGEPKKSLSERVLKRTPLLDVAGMMRSFDYVGSYFLKEKLLRAEDRVIVGSFIENWTFWVTAEYLKAYLEAVRGTNLVPSDEKALFLLLEAHVLNKALYEVTYELSSRPDWVDIPLKGILRLFGRETR